jgi:Fe2+ transport system protein FeoA
MPGTYNHRISAQTVRNRLREFGIRAYRPNVVNPLKLRSSPIRYTTPDHDVTTAKSVPLDNTTVSISFISPTVNTTTTICSKEIKPCAQTVRNRLREFGIRAYRPNVVNPLTPRRRLARMQWLRRYDPRIWRRQCWQAVLFTDESRFNLFRADGRRRVFKFPRIM